MTTRFRLHQAFTILLTSALLFLPTHSLAGWKISFDGSGSSPVIHEGLLYIGSAEGEVMAIDTVTGQIRWRYQTGEGLPSGPQVITVPFGTDIATQAAAGVDAVTSQRAGIRRVDMTPLVKNGLVLVGAGDHHFHALGVDTGLRVWSRYAGSGMASSNNTPYPVPAPLAFGPTVYFVTEDGLHAIDSESGQHGWTFETLLEVPPDKLMKRAPSAPIREDNVLYLSAWPFLGRGAPRISYVYAVDADSGAKIWVSEVHGTNITAPVTVGDSVFVATGASLHAINSTDGTVRWTIGEGPVLGTSRLIAVGELVYFSTDRRLLAVEAATGRVAWELRSEGLTGNLVSDDRFLYVLSWQQSLFRTRTTLQALALATGQPGWSVELSGLGNDIVLGEGVVYAGGADALHAVDARNGRRDWTFRGEGRLSPPVLSGNSLFLSSPTIRYLGSNRVDQGYLYAIDAATGRP